MTKNGEILPRTQESFTVHGADKYTHVLHLHDGEAKPNGLRVITGNPPHSLLYIYEGQLWEPLPGQKVTLRIHHDHKNGKIALGHEIFLRPIAEDSDRILSMLE